MVCKSCKHKIESSKTGYCIVCRDYYDKIKVQHFDAAQALLSRSDFINSISRTGLVWLDSNDVRFKFSVAGRVKVNGEDCYKIDIEDSQGLLEYEASLIQSLFDEPIEVREYYTIVRVDEDLWYSPEDAVEVYHDIIPCKCVSNTRDIIMTDNYGSPYFLGLELNKREKTLICLAVSAYRQDHPDTEVDDDIIEYSGDEAYIGHESTDKLRAFGGE